MKRPFLLLPFVQIEEDMAYKWAGARPVISAICSQRMEFVRNDKDNSVEFTLVKIWSQFYSAAPAQVERAMESRIRIASLILQDVLDDMQEKVVDPMLNTPLTTALVGTMNAMYHQWSNDRSFNDGYPTINAILMHEFGIQESLLGPFRNKRPPLRLPPNPPPSLF